MRVTVLEAGWGGNEYPGEVRVQVTDDNGAPLCELNVWVDVFAKHTTGRSVCAEFQAQDSVTLVSTTSAERSPKSCSSLPLIGDPE